MTTHQAPQCVEMMMTAAAAAGAGAGAGTQDVTRLELLVCNFLGFLYLFFIILTFTLGLPTNRGRTQPGINEPSGMLFLFFIFNYTNVYLGLPTSG